MNQKDVFSKISKPAFAIWALWGLIVLALVWPARERTELPTIDDTHPAFAISGAQEGPNKSGNFKTTFAVEFENPGRIEMLEHLAFRLGTFHKTVELLNASIAIGSTTCKADTPEKTGNARESISDLSYFRLHLDSLKTCLEQGPKSRDVTFMLTLETSSPIVLIGNPKQFDLVENPMPFVRAQNGTKQFVDGQLLQTLNRPLGWKDRLSWPRFRLMAAVWGAEHFFTVLGFFGLLITGASLLCWSMYRLISNIPGSTLKKHSALAPSVAFLGASLLTSLTAPPFQAADEADHFRTFLLATELIHRDEEALKLAQRGHYDRLMCHRDQRLSVENLGCAMTNGWPAHAGPTDGPARSLVADAVWKGIATILPLQSLNIGFIHSGLRLFNGLFVTLALFLALYVFNHHRREPEGENIENDLRSAAGPISVLAVPTLTHFANHNSNHTFLIAAYIVLAIASLNVIMGVKLGWKTTLLLSVSTAMSVFAGRAGVLLWFVTLGLFGIRWITQNVFSDTLRTFRQETSRSILIFLPTIAIGLLYNNQPYVQARLLPLFQNHVAVGLTALVSAAILLPSVLMTLGNLARKLSDKLKAYPTGVTLAPRIPWLGVSGAIFSLYLVSAMLKTPAPIPNIEFTPPISATTYIWLVFKSFIRNSAPGGDDFLLIGSFWGGFGCPVDSLHWFPLWAVQSFLMGGWMLGLFRYSEKNSTIETLKYFGFGLLCCTYLGLLTYAVHSGPSTMHGRYMVGFYLLFIVGSLWGWQRVLQTIIPAQRRITSRNLYSFSFLLNAAGIISLILQFY